VYVSIQTREGERTFLLSLYWEHSWEGLWLVSCQPSIPMAVRQTCRQAQPGHRPAPVGKGQGLRLDVLLQLYDFTFTSKRIKICYQTVIIHTSIFDVGIDK
jgi:hypothetical protein